MALSAAVLGLTIWALTVARDNEKQVSNSVPGASLNLSPAVDSGAALAAAAAFSLLLYTVSTLAAFGFAHVKETTKTGWIKVGLVTFAVIFWFATLVPATFIAATKSGQVSSSNPAISDALLLRLIEASGKDLAYKSYTSVIAYVVVGWVAFLSTAIDLVLITLVFRHNESHGIHNELGVIVGRHDTTGDAEKRGAQLDNSASNTTAVDTSPPSDEPMPAKEV